MTAPVLQETSKIPVIIDTDPGVDDTLAILLAIASPEIEILAYVISFGNTEVDAAYLNIFKIYQAISKHLECHPEDQQRFPNFNPVVKPFLVRGASRSLDGELHTAQDFHGIDGLVGITERHPELNLERDMDSVACSWFQTTDLSATDLTLRLVESHPEMSITYIALGPLTNLATALRANPSLTRDRLGRVICMGGALDVPGNTNPVAEFNFFADPYAVKELLDPQAPGEGLCLDKFLLLPLDVTTPHQISFPYYTARVDPTFSSTAAPSIPHGKSPIVHFTSSFLERSREIMLQYGCDYLELHDIVVVWCALQNPPVRREGKHGLPGSELKPGWKAINRQFGIERTGELTRGMLVVDRRLDQIAHVPDANRAEVQEQLEKFHIPHRQFESTVATQVEIMMEFPIHPHSKSRGVACVVETPGEQVLLKLLLERVWGIKVSQQ